MKIYNKRRRTTNMEYMSQECYDNLVAELRQMELVELPQVRDAIAEARDKGDLSENFEYHAAKREQGRLLGRIRYKQKVLENARVIDKSRLKGDVVANRMIRHLAPPHLNYPPTHSDQMN